MRIGEDVVTYVFGLIGLALVLKNGQQVSNIINQAGSSLGMFSNVLTGGGSR